MKQRLFVQNMSFHIKEKGAKKCIFQISPQCFICAIQSSINILILTINSIASLSNSIVSPEVGRLFSILVIGFEFVHFDPQLINKLSISSIWLLIRSISTFIFTCLFQFGPWFWISSIKSLIVHQTSIFMQLSH